MSTDKAIELKESKHTTVTDPDGDLAISTDSTEEGMRSRVYPECPPSQGDSTGEEEVNPDEQLDGPRRTSATNIFNESPYTDLLNTNQYNVRKMASQTLIDAALMMANISQLRTLLSLGEHWVQYYLLMLSLVSVSLVCQVIFAIIMFVMWMRESDLHQKEDLMTNMSGLDAEFGVSIRDSQKYRDMKSQKMDGFQHNRVTSRLNYISMLLVFIITVINMFITGFSIKIVDSHE